MEEEVLRGWWTQLADKVLRERITDIHFCPSLLEVRVRKSSHIEKYETFENKNDYLRVLDYIYKAEDIDEKKEIDFSLNLEGTGQRARGIIYKAEGGIAMAIRPLPSRPISWKDNLLSKEVIDYISRITQGLVLVTGPTGSGKSTTIASLIEMLNATQRLHIITLEDPIEALFQSKKSIIEQRQVGRDTNSFLDGLRSALRSDPDVIFVGELRDYETTKTALMAADTGHLVFATLHTRRVSSTISRILEMSPESSRSEIRSLLSTMLAMVISQRLIPRRDSGVFPCREIMIQNQAISTMIKEGKENQIPNVLLSNQEKGMQEWKTEILKAVNSGIITPQTAHAYLDELESS